VSNLLDLAAAKRIIVSIPHYLSMSNVKEVIEHIWRFISQMVDEAEAKLEKVKEMLEPLIAKAVEHSGANSEKLKGLLAELTTFAHHSKVPFGTKSHISLMPAQCHRRT
jgi:cation transport regulator ChaC